MRRHLVTPIFTLESPTSLAIEGEGSGGRQAVVVGCWAVGMPPAGGGGKTSEGRRGLEHCVLSWAFCDVSSPNPSVHERQHLC